MHTDAATRAAALLAALPTDLTAPAPAQRSGRCRVRPGSGAAGAGHAGAAASGRGGPARQRRRRRKRFAEGNAAQDAAGHGSRPAHRADAAGLAAAHAALARREQDALYRRVRARDPGPVRAVGQPARHLADQVGNGRPCVPFPGARPLQADRAPAGRKAGRARGLHRRRDRAPAIGAGRQRRARRGQRPAQAYLQHLEQDAHQASGLRPDVRPARAARHRRRRARLLYGAGHGARDVDAHRRGIRRLYFAAQAQRLPLAAHGGG